MLGAALLAVGCTSEPIPLSAQAGSTITIALVGEDTWGEGVGYVSPYFPSEVQRGETVFQLVDDAFGANPTVYKELKTRYVTRCYADPAADVSTFLTGEPLVQIMALVDIPSDTNPGTYMLRYRRRRQTPSGEMEYLTPYVPETPTLLHVLPRFIPGIDNFVDPGTGPRTIEGRPTPALGYFGTSVEDISSSLYSYVPNPKVLITFSPAWDLPAAAHLEVTYPPDRVEIVTAFEEQHPGRGSLVRWSDSNPRGRITIDLVDPDASVHRLAIAFRLADFGAAGPVDVSDFQVVSHTFYRPDGGLDTAHSAFVDLIR
jgi:hypothetical protein